MQITENMRQFILRQKEKADSLLFFLSCIALGLFASNEVMAVKPDLFMIGQSDWSMIQIVARFCIWGSFLAHFVIYAMVSGKPWKYAREHVIEVLICLAWFPHHNVSLLRDLTSLLSVDTVQMVGTLANGLLVVRHIVRSARTHPLIVTGSAFLFVIVAASELLMLVEPQTFHNLFDAIWYAMVTTTTVGYGDIVPHSFAGRCIGMALMVSGISLAGAFIGIVSQLMQRRLGRSEGEKEITALSEKLAAEQETNKRLLAALEKDNELKAKLLALLEKSEQK